LKNIDIEEIKTKVSLKKELRSHLDKDRPLMAENIGKNKSLRNQLKEIEKSITKEENSNNKDENKKIRYEFLTKSIDLLKAVSDKAMLKIKDEIEIQTNESFLKIVGSNEFDRVIISDNYSVDVQLEDSRMTDNLSSGQTQMLAFSFIEALNNKAGLNMPIIIDTPLGRISKENRKRIIKSVTSLLKNRQVILLFTDSEYDSSVATGLSKHLNQSFNISKVRNKAMIGKS